MLFTFQALFLGTTIWDFFLTVIITTSARSEMFVALIPASVFIIVPWIVLIFILTIFLFRALLTRDTDRSLLAPIHLGYGLLCVLYLIFFAVAVVSPLIAWPLVMNYFINAVWAGSIVFFRIRILKSLDSGL